jgi:hypothetical protein
MRRQINLAAAVVILAGTAIVTSRAHALDDGCARMETRIEEKRDQCESNGGEFRVGPNSCNATGYQLETFCSYQMAP